MVALDPRTVLLVASLMSFFMSVVLLVIQRTLPPPVHGLAWCAAAASAFWIAYLLFGFRGHIPQLFDTLVPNAVVVAGSACYLLGTRDFYRQSALYGWAIAGVVGDLVANGWWLWGDPDYRMRLLSTTAIMTAFTAAQLFTVLRHGSRRFTEVFFAGVLVLQVLALAVRCCTATTASLAPASFFSRSTTQSVFYLVHSVTVELVAIGFIMVVMQRLQGELHELAETDPLTGAPNRRAFWAAFEVARARLAADGGVLALFIIDLDHFKRINDGQGHLVGDQILVDFTARLKRIADPMTIARLGGEEFGVVARFVSAEAASRSAEAVCAAAREVPGPGSVSYTVSVGVAVTAVRTTTIAEMMSAADLGLYRAKEAGRDRVAAPVVLADALA